MLLANRTEERANRLAAELGGEKVEFEDFPRYLADADIVICSTAADQYVVTEAMAREALSKRRNRPSFFIDISVPRNIDPAVGKIPNVFVFDIDDLESVISSNIREREREAERAELIVESEIMQFQQTLRVLGYRSDDRRPAKQVAGHRQRRIDATAQSARAIDARNRKRRSRPCWCPPSTKFPIRC